MWDLFGTIKRWRYRCAIVHAVCPEGLALPDQRLQPRLILTQQRAEALSTQFPGTTVVDVNDAFWAALHTASLPIRWTRAPPISQCFSTPLARRASCPKLSSTPTGSVVTLMIAALYGVGLRPR